MSDIEIKYYRLLNKYNELEYGNGTGSKLRSFTSFCVLLLLAVIMNIAFIILGFIGIIDYKKNKYKIYIVRGDKDA